MRQTVMLKHGDRGKRFAQLVPAVVEDDPWYLGVRLTLGGWCRVDMSRDEARRLGKALMEASAD